MNTVVPGKADKNSSSPFAKGVEEDFHGKSSPCEKKKAGEIRGSIKPLGNF